LTGASRAIVAERLAKRFYLRHNPGGSLKVKFLSLLDRRQRETIEEFWALRDVSFTIKRGEAVGLVGRNGSGKSTLLKLIAGLHRPTLGRLLVARRARLATLIELGVGFHPELSGRENVYLNASIYGLTRVEIDGIYPSVVTYSGLEQFIDAPIKTYSSGMHMRLGFAVAANLNPDILLLDEIFAVGDAEFQKQCMATMKQFRQRGTTIVFVSHSPEAVRALCDRVCVLDSGRLTFDGSTREGLAHYEAMTRGQQQVARSDQPA
jgi:ABC-type polysaccharide/polyol phosphate transport system ATPase subunit